MALAAAFTASPTSGSGNGTVNISATAHTGRNQRTTQATISATGATSKTVAVAQSAKAEFVAANNVSATKEGGNVTITGTSNSAKLTFSLGTGDITITAPTAFTAGGAAATSGTAITGDPGATAEYSWSATIAVPANATTAAKTRSITVTANGGQTATATISQAAGDPTLNVTPASITIPAGGTAQSVSITSNTNWTVA
jgi:hypothetical protein